jgi:hypothetical protein
MGHEYDNVMQEEGRTKFLAIVEEIKRMVLDLWCVLKFCYPTLPLNPPMDAVI